MSVEYFLNDLESIYRHYKQLCLLLLYFLSGMKPHFGPIPTRTGWLGGTDFLTEDREGVQREAAAPTEGRGSLWVAAKDATRIDTRVTQRDGTP